MGEKQKITNLSIRQLLDGNNDIKQNTLQIVQILGGIESILYRYLEENTASLSTSQLSQLHQLITTPLKYQEKNKNILPVNIQQNRQHQTTEDTDCNLYTFNVNDTILHSICSPTNAGKITHFIHDKIAFALFVIIACIGWVISGIFGGNSMIYSIYAISEFCLYGIPWLTLLHLSFNKQAYKLVVKGFEYWVKTGYCIMMAIASLFHRSSSDSELRNIADGCSLVWIVLGISYVSAFDAVQTKKRNKLFLSVSTALFATFYAINLSLFDPESNDYKITISITNSVISMQSLLASSIRILAIFLWKQSFNVWRKNGRAVSISYSPRLIWIDDDNNNNNKKKVIMHQEKESDDLEEEEKEEIKIEAVLMTKKREKSFSLSDSDENDR